MTTKYKAKDGLTFDDVKQSMELRANTLNFKKVGHSPMWKDIQAVLGDMDAPRMEVFHYCDIAAGRDAGTETAWNSLVAFIFQLTHYPLPALFRVIHRWRSSVRCLAAWASNRVSVLLQIGLLDS